MSDPFNGPGAAPIDFRRDRWGRPLIMQPDGNRIAYYRASAAAKTIEDTYNLELWARRNVAFGLAADPSLVARVLAVGGTPHEWDSPSKKTVNDIVKDAEKVAQAHRAADIGTALHQMTEQLDRGQRVTAGPYQADIDAYQAALDSLGLNMLPELVECRMVCDSLQLAGTCDRVALLDGRHVIADLKTGGSVEYAVLGYAAQLAAYAHSQLYDPAAEQRCDTPTIDRENGYIIHLPAGQGTCSIYRVNLTRGYAAAELANQVRIVRKEAKTWMTAAVSSDTARRDRLRQRYQQLTTEQQLAYTALNPDRDDLDAVEAALDQVDPFAQQLDPVERTPTPAVEAAAPLDEGPDATADDVDVLRKAWEFLDDTQSAWVRDAVAAAGNLSVQQRASQRRVQIGTALVQLAAAGWHDDRLLDACIRHSRGGNLDRMPVDDADRFADTVNRLTTGQLAWGVDGDQICLVEAEPQQAQAKARKAS